MAEYIISSGETSSGIILENDSLTVLDGGVATDTTVNSAGNMRAFSGGTANSTTVNSNGYLYVSSGGTANSTTVNSGGRLYVYSGGVASGVSTTSSGFVHILSGGRMEDAFLSGGISGDMIFIEPGAIVSGAQVVNGADLVVSGSAYDVVLKEGKSANGDWSDLKLRGNGYAENVTVYENGSLEVGNNCTLRNATINSGALLIYNNGATFLNTVINAGFSWNISGGKTVVSGATVNSDGLIRVSSGGVVNSTTVNSAGYFNISSGGTANSTTVNNGGTFDIFSGGIANDVVINCEREMIHIVDEDYIFSSSTGSGKVHVSSGGALNRAVVSGGSLIVEYGGVADQVTINNYGNLILSGGIANDTTVNTGGFMQVFKGGVVNNATIEGCSESDPEFPEDAGIFIYTGGSGKIQISAGGSASGTTVNGGFLDVRNSGVAEETFVNAYGTLNVSSGGRLTGRTTIANGATVSAFTGANLDFDISTLAAGAEARINDLSLISGWRDAIYTLTVDGSQENGTYTLAEGAGGFNKTITVVNTFGDELGTIAVGQTAAIGAFICSMNLADNVLSVTVGNSVSPISSGMVISSGQSAVVHSGDIYEDTTILPDGSMYISRGGIANNTFNSRGVIEIEVGGVANDTTVGEGHYFWWENGRVFVSSGGSLNRTMITGGSVFVLFGGTANDTTITDYGGLDIDSSARADGITIIGSDTEIEIGSGGTATNIVASEDVGFEIRITKDTYVQGTQAGSAFLIKDGVVSGYIPTGWMIVSSGCTASDPIVNIGCEIDLVSGCTATKIRENGGCVNVADGASVTFAAHSFSGLELVSWCSATVHSGTTANSTTVNSDGYFHIYSGGIANSTTVNSDGRMLIDFGGRLTGRTTIANGATVSAFSCANLDFDISTLAPGAEARINDLSLISGWRDAIYTLTVSDMQEKGVYTLAEGAGGFNKTITIQNTLGETLGTLSVGETQSVGDTDYTLNLGTETAADTLTLTLEQNDTDAPVITLTGDTESVCLQTTLTATVDDGSQIYYRISESGNWKKYTEPIIASLNETYFFKATDEAGNTGTNQITFGNIDTTGVMLSTLWAQSGVCPMGGNTTIEYNEYTPYDPTVTPDTHSKTGCSNTAVGQLIYYFIEKQGLDLALTLDKTDEYTYSHRGEGDEPISIKINADGSTPGTLSFAAINDLLADFKLDSAEHAAALVYACGVVQKSKYYASSTGTSWKKSVFTRSGLACVILDGPFFENYWGGPDDEYKYHISDAGFEVLIENLEAGRPVGTSFPGHALVIDGYDRESDTFHINYGWGYNQATRWYTREEMFEAQLKEFVYDLRTDYVETFTVTDARVYGTGTMIRAFEQAYGMLGANTVAFNASVAGKTVELQDMIMLREETAVSGFNMNVLVVNAFIHSMPSYGFYAYENDSTLTFQASGGSLIVSTSNEYNHAFNLSKASSATVEVGNMLIYGGNDPAGASAVLEALQVARSENTEVPEDMLDPNGWSYFGSAGNDVFSLSNLSIAIGNVTLGDGDDVLSLAGHSRLYGKIDAGDGDDSITVDSTSSISGDLSGNSKLNFVLTELEDHALFTIKKSVSDLYSNATLSVDMTDAEIGTYTLFAAASGATGIEDLQNMVFTVTGSGAPDFTLSINGTPTSDFADLIYEGNSLKLQVKKKSAIVVPQTQTWEKIGEATQYIVEYSTDDFGHVVQVAVDSNALDSYQLPEGTYQVRVKPEDGEWTVIEPVDAPDTGTEPKLVKSNEDGNSDVFYAKASVTWSNLYCAQHVGSANDWNGTKEIVSANGKNRLADLFFGSDDANILCLTDDENGDGIFVDDEFTELPDGIEWQQARLAQIDEIRAGAGDDIVDMTSQRFEYIGDEMTVRGGAGNDTIWANKSNNWLFGDAGNDRIVGASGNDVIVGGIGNDRMHGGGGNDVFTFCDNWGTDTVEQLATGSVTLWFTSGSETNWNAETLTYTDGDNSVKVSGITADRVSLKFGDDGTDQFAMLSGRGAFFDATSERIFEETGKGILASL